MFELFWCCGVLIVFSFFWVTILSSTQVSHLFCFCGWLSEMEEWNRCAQQGMPWAYRLALLRGLCCSVLRKLEPVNANRNGFGETRCMWSDSSNSAGWMQKDDIGIWRASKMYQLVMIRVAGEYRANGKHSTFRSVPSGEAGKQHTGCFLPALQKA